MTLTFKIRGTDPVTQDVITDAVCTVNAYAPPKNPSVNVPDRTADFTLTTTYDPVSRFYLASVATTGWAAGTWWLQALLAGGAANYNAWAYASFPLLA
jgi:hypothetical protein